MKKGSMPLIEQTPFTRTYHASRCEPGTVSPLTGEALGEGYKDIAGFSNRVLVQQFAAQIPFFATAWLDRTIVQGVIAQLPWCQNISLRQLKRPIGVAQWETKIVKSLSKDLKGSLPTVKKELGYGA